LPASARVTAPAKVSRKGFSAAGAPFGNNSSNSSQGNIFTFTPSQEIIFKFLANDAAGGIRIKKYHQMTAERCKKM